MPPKQAKKKKGLSLTPEKKKLLRQLIVQKAAEELKKQQEKEAEEKRKVVDGRVPKLEVEGLDQSGLEKKVREFFSIVSQLEEEKYDWEGRLVRQLEEINELNIKVNDIKGKFSKPMLKKVAKKSTVVTKSKLTSFANLKSTGQSKFALEPEKDEEKKPDWAGEQLKRKEEGAPEEGEAVEEEE